MAKRNSKKGRCVKKHDVRDRICVCGKRLGVFITHNGGWWVEYYCEDHGIIYREKEECDE